MGNGGFCDGGDGERQVQLGSVEEGWMIAGDAPMIFGDFDYLVVAGLGVDGLQVD